MRICLLGKNLSNFVLANVLANKKLKIDILFSSDFYNNDSSRTLAISEENYDYLKKVNNKLNISAWPTKNIKIYLEKLRSQELFEFNNKEKNNFFLIQYKEIYNFFLKNLKKRNNVNFFKIKKNSKVLYQKIKKYDLIINSDPKSHVSKRYFYKKVEKNYNSTAYTSIVTHKKLKNNISVQIFTKKGPLAFLPLSDTRTSIVFSYNGRKKITEKQIIEIIKRFNIKYNLNKFGKIEKYNLKFSMLRKYFHQNILSFGDVLHRVHPLAGQGFNMTIRDIKILSKLIEEKIDLGLEINSSVADEFQNKTKHLNYIYGSGIDLIYEFFKLDHKVDNILSDKIFKILNKNNFFNKYAAYISDKGITY